LGTAAALAAHKGPPSAAQVIALLNRERAANGLPATLTENHEWSWRCARHLAYMERTGLLVHDENPGAPGFSAGGAWAAANSVLAQEGSFASGADPFDSAPLHLAALMNPYLTRVGAADDGRDVCVSVTGTAATVPGPPRRFWSVPGDGRTDVPVAERATELPFAPGERVGLAAGSLTGPYLIVYPGPAFSTAVRVVGASLRLDDATSVPVRSVEPGQLGEYGDGPVFVIPVTPLAHGTHYTAAVFLADASTGAAAVISFSFTTAGGPHHPLSARVARHGRNAHP
jgi:hypothetical protein